MGITKSQMFSEEQNELAKIAKVLGHPARIAILTHIINSNACICNDLVDEIGLAQATISQHLKELKSIGIISGAIEGKSICYCINKSKWLKIQQQLTQFFNSVKTNNSCC
jgi:predicted transcriptional regulator